MNSDAIYIDAVKRTGHYSMQDNEYHDSFEMYYLLSGERRYFIHNHSHLIHPGDLVLIPPQVVHQTIDTGRAGHERILIQFQQDYLGSLEPDRRDILLGSFGPHGRVIRLSAAERGTAEHLLQLMVQEHKSRADGWEVSLYGLMLQLLVWTSRLEPLRHSEAESPAHSKVKIIVDYLHEHFRQPLTLSGVAQACYISPYHMCRIFRTYTGFHFSAYLQLLRIKEAQRLLRETPLKVLDISQTVGFVNLSHFQKVFKTQAGQTPLQYRKLWRAAQERR